MTELAQIDQRIDELRKELKNNEGTRTEVYARIVGYYRSVQNWNKGKKEEFFDRKTFSQETFTPRLFERETLDQTPKTASSKSLGENVKSYLYFYRMQCPQCPPVARLIGSLPLPGTKIDADTEEGREIAAGYFIASTPTVLFLDDDKKEVFRVTQAGELKLLLDRENAPAGV
jgi:ribonucleoside-triphosphate reductase